MTYTEPTPLKQLSASKANEVLMTLVRAHLELDEKVKYLTKLINEKEKETNQE
jgi:hypothetical protein